MTFIFTLFLGLLHMQVVAAPADFKVTLDYKSNKKIWGTYSLLNENVLITRGKDKWSKQKKKQLGDLIIKDGHLHFFKASRDNGLTKILIEKVPYKKEKESGKDNYKSNNKLNEKEFETIFAQGINELIPHKDLLDGEVKYSHISCLKKSKGVLRCTITGQLFSKPKVASNLK